MATNLTVRSFRIPKALVEELEYLKIEYNINPSAVVRSILEDGIPKLKAKLEGKLIVSQKAKRTQV